MGRSVGSAVDVGADIAIGSGSGVSIPTGVGDGPTGGPGVGDIATVTLGSSGTWIPAGGPACSPPQAASTRRPAAKLDKIKTFTSTPEKMPKNLTAPFASNARLPWWTVLEEKRGAAVLWDEIWEPFSDLNLRCQGRREGHTVGLSSPSSLVKYQTDFSVLDSIGDSPDPGRGDRLLCLYRGRGLYAKASILAGLSTVIARIASSGNPLRRIWEQCFRECGRSRDRHI